MSMIKPGKTLDSKNPGETKAEPKKKKEYDFSAHGIGIAEYIATPGIPDWIKVLHFMIWWYLQPKHRNSVFFMSYKGIKKAFKKMGYADCTIRNIEEAFRILKTPEAKGGVDLIKVVYAEVSKWQWIEQGNNPKKWVYRKVYLNWNRIHKYFSIFTTEGTIFKSLKPKSRLKKLVRARSMSFTKHLQVEFELAMKEAKIEKYKTARQMFYGFLYTVSRKFYDVTKLIKKFIPEHTIDLQKEQDRMALLEAIDLALRGSPYDPFRNVPNNSDTNVKREAPASFKTFVKAII